MGGYGAFKWAMHNPEKFRCCGVFSGPIGIVPHETVHYKENEIGLREDENEPCPEGFKTMIAAFGSAKDRRNTPDDNFYMIEQHLKKHTDLPEFYISTGQEDAIAFDNYSQAEWMHQAGLEFIDIRDHGRHNWEYCDKKVKEFLEWIPLKNVFKMEEA